MLSLDVDGVWSAGAGSVRPQVDSLPTVPALTRPYSYRTSSITSLGMKYVASHWCRMVSMAVLM